MTTHRKENESAIKYLARNIAHKLKFNSVMDKRFVKRTFMERAGYAPNLSQPQSFNEYIQWFKLNNRESIHSQLADKIAVRDYVKERCSMDILIPLYQTGKNVRELTEQTLPDEAVVIKSNHASGQVFIVKDKTQFDFQTMYHKLGLLLGYNFYHANREWHYQNIPPQYMVEKFIEDKNGEAPPDYKIHCFNGEIKFIQVDTERFNGHKRRIYTPDWQPLDITWNFPQGDLVAPPTRLSDMKKIAQELAEGHPYVRVDLYTNDADIYFGELTFTPEAGFGRFTPVEVDYEWGQLYKEALKS